MTTRQSKTKEDTKQNLSTYRTMILYMLENLTPITTFLTIFDLLLFLSFHYLGLILVSRMLKKASPSIKSALISGIIASLALFLVTLYMSSKLLYPAFFLYSAVLCFIFFGASIIETLFIASAYLINASCIRGIITNILAGILRINYAEFHSELKYMLVMAALVCVTFIIACFFILRKIGGETLHIIMQDSTQVKFITLYMFLVSFYNLIDSEIYKSDLPLHKFYPSSILKYATLLGAGYLLLFYTKRINELAGFEESSHKLQNVVHTQEGLRKAFLNDALVQYEVNLTKNEFVSGFEPLIEHLFNADVLPKKKLADIRTLKLNYTSVVEMASKIVAPEDRKQFMDIGDLPQLLWCLENGEIRKQIQFRAYSRNGKSPIWVDLIMNLYRDAESGDVMMLSYYKDITADMKSLKKLGDMATRDSMLGIYNKGHTEELVSKALEDAGGALLIIDVDDFKDINDTEGHQKGDEILIRLTSQIKSVLRKSDIFGRVGGDEFLVFMQGLTSRDIAERKLREILNSARIYVRKGRNGEDIYLSISIGICIAEEPGKRYADMFESADKALYMSKNGGKGRYTFADNNCAEVS